MIQSHKKDWRTKSSSTRCCAFRIAQYQRIPMIHGRGRRFIPLFRKTTTSFPSLSYMDTNGDLSFKSVRDRMDGRVAEKGKPNDYSLRTEFLLDHYNDPFRIHNTTFTFQEMFTESTYRLNENLTIPSSSSFGVKMKVWPEEYGIWSPKLFHSPEMFASLNHRSTTIHPDVHFEVGGQHFPMNKTFLSIRAPGLYEMVKDEIVTEQEPIRNVGVADVDIFQAVVRFIVAEEVPSNELVTTHGKGLLHAANMFECTKLKHVVEAKIVELHLVETKCGKDWLDFAESHCCALLKEHATIIVVQEGMKLRVATLRRKLDELGLDVGGTREMLIARLDAAAQQKDKSTEEEDLEG